MRRISIKVFCFFVCILISLTSFSQNCNCNEYLYVNDTDLDLVHKFEVNSSDGSLTEVDGDLGTAGIQPWLTGINDPHGLATDLNGYIYIGELGQGIWKMECDGTVLDNSAFAGGASGRNFAKLDNLILTNSPGGRITAWDPCDGSEFGRIELDNADGGDASWGFYFDGVENYYASAKYFGNFEHSIWRFNLTKQDFIDESEFLPVLGNAAFPNTDKIWGITANPAGDYFILTYDNNGDNVLLKYDANDNFVTSVSSPVGTSPWDRGQGIYYSNDADVVYISGGDPTNADCVGYFDPVTLAYTTVIPHVTGQDGKGLAIAKECCPAPVTQVIDETYCDATVNDRLFLNEIFPCDGIICGGEWIPDSGNTGMAYNSCDQSILITALEACGTFIKAGTTNQCGTFNITYNLDVLTTPSITISGNNPTCATNNDPNAIMVNTSGGSGSIVYTWQSSTTDCESGFTDIPGAPTDGAAYDPPALTQETYFRLVGTVSGNCSNGNCTIISNCLTLTPENGCAPTCTLTVSCSKNDLTNCAPLNGSVTAVPSGNQGNLSYNWENSSGTQIGTTATVNNLPAGDYNLTVTDDIEMGCEATCTVTIVNNSSQPTATCSATDNTNCNSPNGSASVATNAINPTYAWSNGMTTAAINNLSNGTYTVTVNDGTTGCTNECDAIVMNNTTDPTLTCTKIDNTSCTTPNGSVNSTANNVSYAWNTGAMTSSINGLSAGTYSLTVTDLTSGCTAECSETIIDPNSPICTVNANTQPSCADPSEGSATANASGGVAPYTYLWNDVNAQTTATATGLSGGNYTVTVTDANNCTTTCSVLLNTPTNCCPTISNPTPPQTICEGQTVTTISINTDTASPDQIEFVYFDTPQAGNAAYTSGTSIGTVSPNAGVASISNVSFPSNGIYYVYARLSPTPPNANCRPSEEIIVTVNPSPDINLMVSDTTICDETDGVVLVFNSEIGVNYQLRDDSNDAPIGSFVAGTGNAIQLPFTNLTPTGTRTYNVLATNGTTSCNAELIDKAVITIQPCDYDYDLPVCAFPACHFTSNDIYLGAEVTNDDPDTGEVGADDGVAYPNNIRPGINVRFPVTIYNNTGQTAYLSGWVDWNGDGDFDDAGEQIAQETYPANPPNTGTFVVSIPVNVPSDAVQDNDLAVRWRLSSDPSIAVAPCGAQSCATDGEVEDYLIQVECPPRVCVPVEITINRN